MPDTALLLIELQNEVLHPDGKLAGTFPSTAEPLLSAIRQLVDWAHHCELAVIWCAWRFGRATSMPSVIR
jgi:nicotinamidase-related amidase